MHVFMNSLKMDGEEPGKFRAHSIVQLPALSGLYPVVHNDTFRFRGVSISIRQVTILLH